jgi:hypothetical protein
LFHAVAVISGLMRVKLRRGNSATVLVVLAHLFGGQIISGIALPATLTVMPAFAEFMAGGNLGRGMQVIPKFFGAELPLWVQSFAYQIPLTAFLFLACVRRMHSAESPMYSKPQACGFLMTVAALTLAGLIDPPVQQVQDLARVGALISMMIAGLALVSCVTPEAGDVANGFRRVERLGERHVSLWNDAAHNGLVAGLLGFIVLASGEAATALLPAARLMQPEHVHLPPIIAGLTIMYFGWALQFFHLKYRRRARGYFTVFLFAFWGVPLLLAAILGLQFQGGDLAENIASISPLASIASGNLVGLISAIIPTLVFGVLLRETIGQFEREILDGEIVDASSVVV